jgi:hypothetical protein
LAETLYLVLSTIIGEGEQHHWLLKVESAPQPALCRLLLHSLVLVGPLYRSEWLSQMGVG